MVNSNFVFYIFIMNRVINLIISKPNYFIKHYSQLRSFSSPSYNDLSSRNKSPINTYTERTHNCGQLTTKELGKDVTLFGWVQYTRFDNKIISLRDSYGAIQCVLRDNDLANKFRKINIPNESVIKVTGIVNERPEKQKTSKYLTGQIEIVAKDINILSSAKKDLPILTRNEPNSQTTWENRLKHRYLDLRKPDMQHALRFRSFVSKILRDKLHDINFVECETPTLFNRTPGGANEFIVPTQEPDKFYSLVQSPQQLKQLLMIGGLDRYFQFCRCYRDEATRSDRQPEFTQLDLELSFTNQNLIMQLVDDLVYHLMVNVSDDATQQNFTTSSDKKRNIRKISYSEAIEKYGTDKPDMRINWLIETQKDGLKLHVPNISDTMAIELIESTRISMNYDPPIVCCDNKNGIDIKTVDTSDASRKVLGAIRNSLGKKLNAYDKQFAFVWVTDFPLFITDKQGKFQSNHHPFTAPTDETASLLKSDPLKVVGQHYDLVLNGQEIAGGSIRIHDPEMQHTIFNDVLKLETNTFKYFIDALRSGCPPHGGIAFGLDRLIASLMDRNSIRDVIAFPKSSTGRDLLSDCPHNLTADVKQMYHIK